MPAEVRVLMRRALDGGALLRSVRGYSPAADDTALLSAVLEVAGAYTRSGNTRFPLVMDATADIPWKEVVHVMDLCRRNKISRIELGLPEREISR